MWDCGKYKFISVQLFKHSIFGLQDKADTEEEEHITTTVLKWKPKALMCLASRISDPPNLKYNVSSGTPVSYEQIPVVNELASTFWQ